MFDALAKVYKSIIELSGQAPRSHQGDSHKVEFRRNAVVGTPWPSEPLRRVATHQLTFQQLYAELEAALQLQKETKMAMLRDCPQLGRRTLPEDDSARIMYAGQGRYYHGKAGCSQMKQCPQKRTFIRQSWSRHPHTGSPKCNPIIKPKPQHFVTWGLLLAPK